MSGANETHLMTLPKEWLPADGPRMDVVLDDAEIKHAVDLADRRHANYSRWIDSLNEEKRAIFCDVDNQVEFVRQACCAEWAVHKAMPGLRFNGSDAAPPPSADFVTPDGRTVDVKWTREHHFRLVCHATYGKTLDQYCDVFILVTGVGPEYRIRGWTDKNTFINDENFHAKGLRKNGTACYALDQYKLSREWAELMTHTNGDGRVITLDDINKLFKWCDGKSIPIVDRNAQKFIRAFRNFTNNDLQWLCKSLLAREKPMLLDADHCALQIKSRNSRPGSFANAR